MSIVSSFCFSRPLGSRVIFSVYHEPYQPPAKRKKSRGGILRASKAPLLCSLGQVVERKDLNHLFVFISVEGERACSLLSLVSVQQKHPNELLMRLPQKHKLQDLKPRKMIKKSVRSVLQTDD